MITLPFRLGVDHENKLLRVRMSGKDDREVEAALDPQQLTLLIAILTHCQHALVLAHAGYKIDLGTWNPEEAFKPVDGKRALGAYEGLSRFATGVDQQLRAVALLLLGSSGRLTNYRIGAQTARNLARTLLESADDTPTLPEKQ